MIFRRAYSTASNWPKFAIVGSGPAGIYTSSAILHRLPECILHIFDRNPVPYGLVQYGVAPDHLDMKRCINQFEKTFLENLHRMSLFCNVNIGSDLTFDELSHDYNAIVLAYGANKSRYLNVPNADAKNCISGGDFVSWYNGAPSSSAPLLDKENVVIIGNGNVSIDCARILLSSIERLKTTDMPAYAVDSLKQSRVRNVRIFGRRGPVESSFTIKELRELLNLEGCASTIQIPEELITQVKEATKSLERPKKRIVELMLDRIVPKHSNADKKCSIEFFLAPEAVTVDQNHQVTGVQLRNTRTNEKVHVPCGLLIYAIGFENILLPGLPQNNGKLLMSDWCRVPNEKTKVYATGWCAHNPTGVIAQTQTQSVAVAEELLADWNNSPESPKPGSQQRLDERKISYITFQDWQYINDFEKKMGEMQGKSREKILDVTGFCIRNLKKNYK